MTVSKNSQARGKWPSLIYAHHYRQTVLDLRIVIGIHIVPAIPEEFGVIHGTTRHGLVLLVIVQFVDHPVFEIVRVFVKVVTVSQVLSGDQWHDVQVVVEAEEED